MTRGKQLPARDLELYGDIESSMILGSSWEGLGSVSHHPIFSSHAGDPGQRFRVDG